MTICPQCHGYRREGEPHVCGDHRIEPRFATGDRVWHFEGRWLRDCEIDSVGELCGMPTYSVRGFGAWSKYVSYPALDGDLFPMTEAGRESAVKCLQDVIGRMEYEINRITKAELEPEAKENVA